MWFIIQEKLEKVSSYVIINALRKMTVVRTVPLAEINCNWCLTLLVQKHQLLHCSLPVLSASVSEELNAAAPLLVFGTRSVMGLSGLNCPLAVWSGIHSARWQICGLKPLTSSSTWAVTLTAAASGFGFHCDAVQLRCVRVQRWEHGYQHTPSTRVEWGQRKGHEEGGVTRMDCKFSASDPRCTSRHSGAELWPAVRVCFPFLRLPKLACQAHRSRRIVKQISFHTCQRTSYCDIRHD